MQENKIKEIDIIALAKKVLAKIVLTKKDLPHNFLK